jgi:hypothetical protein
VVLGGVIPRGPEQLRGDDLAAGGHGAPSWRIEFHEPQLIARIADGETRRDAVALGRDHGPLARRGSVIDVGGARHQRRRQRHAAGAIDEVGAVGDFVHGVDVLGALADHRIARLQEQVLDRLIREVGLVAHRGLDVLRHRLAPDRIVGIEPPRLLVLSEDDGACADVRVEGRGDGQRRRRQPHREEDAW